jgi:phosphatidylglycerol---prolipoprotein diacylglyceryl transferase
MHPILFQFGGVIVGTHNAFIALGVAAAAVVFVLECRRQGEISEQMLWIVGGALIAGAIGAKLTAILGAVGDPVRPALGPVIIHGGRSILGGLTGGYLGVLITKRMVHHDRPTGDLFAPAIALGMAIGRWGCFFSELPGTPTTLPWGIRLTPLQVMRIPNCPAYCQTAALHPSFAYEIVFHAVLFTLLWTRWRWQPSLRGELLKLYLLYYAIFRFAVEFVRGNEVVWNGLTRHQLFIIPVFVWLAVHFIRRRRSPVTVASFAEELS